MYRMANVWQRGSVWPAPCGPGWPRTKQACVMALGHAGRGRGGRGDAPEAGPHAYGALGLGDLANALKEPRASHIYFIVRDDASRADLLFQTSDTTWQAYNRAGITSTYGSFDPARPMERAYKVSMNRPYGRATTAPSTSCSTPSTRWCAGSRRTATTSAIQPASTAIGAAR